MFERFTDRARRVVVRAQEEARLLNHNYIGTEHILLGLIHEGEGVAARGLESLGIDLDSGRAKVIEIIGPGSQAPSGHIPFTPRAGIVLKLSLREALQLGHNYIGTEHILLGLIREGEGVGAQVLQRLGAEPHQVHQTVIQLLSGSSATESEGRPAGSPTQGAWPTEWLIAHGDSPRSPGFVGVVNGGGTPLGVVGALAAAFVMVAIVAVLVDRPLGNLAGTGLIVLIGAVATSTVSAAVQLLPSASGHRNERFVLWAALVALVLFAAGALLLGLDALLD